MGLDEWITALHAKVEPPGRTSIERTILFLRPRLEDLSPYWFTEAAIDALFLKLRSLQSAERVRSALHEFHKQRTPALPPQPPKVSQAERDRIAWEDRQVWLARDWDDPARIQRKVRDCGGNVVLLRLLAKIVRKWAPQHLGFLPPHIIGEIEQDNPVAPADKHLRWRRQDDMEPPEGTRSVAEQLAALGVVQPEADRPGARYATPAQLDRINPLPDGRKRHVA